MKVIENTSGVLIKWEKIFFSISLMFVYMSWWMVTKLIVVIIYDVCKLIIVLCTTNIPKMSRSSRFWFFVCFYSCFLGNTQCCYFYISHSPLPFTFSPSSSTSLRTFYLFRYILAALGLCCGLQVSVVAKHGLSCPTTGWILVSWSEVKPISRALKGRFSTTGPPPKSQWVSF